MKTTIVSTIFLGALAAGSIFGGCSSAGDAPPEPPGSESAGTIGLQLQIATGITLSRVNYTITGPAGFQKMASIDVSNSGTISAVISGIPLGVGYVISLSGNAAGDKAVCAGSAASTSTARPRSRSRCTSHATFPLAPAPSR